MSEIGLGYRIGAAGADDTIQKLRTLHEEIRNGTISAKNYRQEHRELTVAGRAATQEFSDMKGAIAATNPNLLEFTRTMSIFGGVANTAMSALNTINLAMIQGSNAAQEMSAANRQAAVDYNDYIRLYNSPQYGPGSPVTEAAYQKWQADLNQISNIQKQLGIQSVDTAISVTVSALAIAGSMSQTAIALKAIEWDKVFAGITTGAESALAGVTWFAGAVLLPLAAAVAAFYGAYYLIRALNPAYAQSMDELSNIIQNNWHVSSIEAQLVAPFVGAYLGMAKLEDEISEDMYNFVNNLINLVNTVPNAVNSAFGRIVIPTIPNLLPPGFANGGQDSFYNQAIRDLNIGSTNTATNPSATGLPLGQNLTTDQIKQQLQDMVQSGTKTATNSDTSLAALSGIGTTLEQNNQSLSMINSGVAGLLQPLIDQKNAAAQMKDSINTQIATLTQQIADLSAQPQTQQYAYHFDSDTGLPNDIRTIPTDAANQLAQAKASLAALQSTVSGLDNYTSGLAPVLNSIGLSGETGIGSIISSALGGAAGVGGAGISAGELQYFAQTGDYGVFTAAAIRDNTVQTPTQQDQINALLKSWQGSGLTGYTAADAAKALGYGGAVSSGSSNYSSTGGQFGGLPGQYGQPSVTVNNNIAGSVLSNQSLKDVVNMSVKEALQATF